MTGMPRLGIVGFTNSGKTTVFNALTGLDATTAAHPFTTLEPNIGVARVPDHKLETVAKLEGSAKVVPATLELLDLPAMSHPGESSGLGGQFLGRLREMDALVVVLRAFTNPAVPDDGSGVDPLAQAEELLLELALADHEVLARRAERLTKEAGADPSKRSMAQALAEAAAHVGGGEALRLRSWSEEAQSVFRDSPPLTLKPSVWVINVDENSTYAGTTGPDQLPGQLPGQLPDHLPGQLVEEVMAVVPPGDTVVAISARLEEEGARLSADERAELFEGLGLGEGALATMVRAAFHGLDLITFYTVGPKESRVWTVRSGAKAPEAAGKIHSDLERGFIRAEVSTIDQVIASGGWDQAKRDGHTRVEGKIYQVTPGDVLVIRFSV